MTGSTKYLRDWAKDIRDMSGMSVDADRLEKIADEIESLRKELCCSRTRNEEARRDINRMIDKHLKGDES